MARKRFTLEQIVVIIRESEQTSSVEELLRRHNISATTLTRWRRLYGNLGVSEVQRIKQLEEENRKLKQLLGDKELAIQAMQEVAKKRALL